MRLDAHNYKRRIDNYFSKLSRDKSIPDGDIEILKRYRDYLVSEGLSDLRYTEGQLAPHGGLDVGEVHEDTLCRLRPEVHLVGVVLDTMRQIEAQLLMRQYEGFIR